MQGNSTFLISSNVIVFMLCLSVFKPRGRSPFRLNLHLLGNVSRESVNKLNWNPPASIVPLSVSKRESVMWLTSKSVLNRNSADKVSPHVELIAHFQLTLNIVCSFHIAHPFILSRHTSERGERTARPSVWRQDK